LSRIELRNVNIEFPVFGHRSFRKTLVAKYAGGLLGKMADNDSDTVIVRALIDISLAVTKGDCLGLIGHNGSGKTTLLKTMAGVLPPAMGEVHSEGKISPMFATGLGMDPEDSGYENINTMGLYLGMTPLEIKERVPEIEAFCELGEFLNLPVRTYSSGMMVRLSFAVATCLEPEILLLDEGLGAGDARFAEKAKRRVDKLIESSSILVLASHSTSMIRDFCNKALLLDHGRIIHEGEVEEVIGVYDEMNEQALAADAG